MLHGCVRTGVGSVPAAVCSFMSSSERAVLLVAGKKRPNRAALGGDNLPEMVCAAAGAKGGRQHLEIHDKSL